MILHLLTEEKFTDYAIEQFESREFCSKFVLIPSNANKYIVKNIDKVEVVNQQSPEFDKLINSLKKYKAIILHGMHWGIWQTTILKNIPTQVKVAWVFWGGDLYGRSDVKFNTLAPFTKFIVETRNLLKRTKSNKNSNWEISRMLFKKVDYCLSDEFEEYEFARKELNNSMKYCWYNYYSLEDTLGELLNKRCVGNGIVIGNSATKECNYYDVLLKVKTLDVQKRKILLPLSYGTPWIRNFVSKFGKMLFTNVYPLCDYLERNEYNRILLNCNTMIMAHYYPQAQGNIITGLWLGMKVYLSEKNMTYHYFRRIGCKVYSIEKDLNRDNNGVFLSEDEDTIMHNREVLTYWYSKENMRQRNLKLVTLLNN